MHILFLNSKNSSEIQKYGKKMYSNISHFCDYEEVDNEQEYQKALIGYDTIIYNYHPSTMQWLNIHNVNANKTNICIPHEQRPEFFFTSITLDGLTPFYKNLDFSVSTTIDRFINYRVENFPVIGTFAFTHMNFEDVVKVCMQKFSQCIIKLLLPKDYFTFEQLQEIWKSINICPPSIKIFMCTENSDDYTILKFLNSNDINLFFYNGMPNEKVVNTMDLALSSTKPMGISNSYMFKDFWNPSMVILNDGIFIDNFQWCMENSVKHFSRNNEKLVQTWEKILFSSHSFTEADIFVLRTLGYKRNGTFLEIGVKHPVVGNNTYLLEKFGWKGTIVMENPQLLDLCKKIRSESVIITKDPREIDYQGADYLYINCDVENRSNLDVLEKLINSKFQVVMFKHGGGKYFDALSVSREILTSRGYRLVKEFPEEDWWIF